MGALSSKSRGTSHRSREYVSTTTPESHEKPQARERLKLKYSRIGDDYNSLEQVTEDLSNAGLESSNLIVGIDFTKSNEWAGLLVLLNTFTILVGSIHSLAMPLILGRSLYFLVACKVSFNHRSLHDMDCSPNPYEQAISVIGRTLSAFDEDNLIPCFGFGDATTHDQEVFSFFPNNRPCNGFEEALERYREILPHLRLAGPTSFAPIIETAISIVDQTGGQYHVLLIIADGQVTSGVGKHSGKLSSQERDTINAIVKASDYPLSIVLVGVVFFFLYKLIQICFFLLRSKRRGIPRRKRPQSSISDPFPGVDKSNPVVSSASAVNDKKVTYITLSPFGSCMS
ncbi:hypothetical protein ZIOFF_073020 [Zingiber officinale]|uniref:Copine C-terminal domain-containing protein n=1 Tax=Zingiber officinale TaxID=94328 RepID=A0A8J5ESH2_ZINOF|nr:hypothetical protein ZIOFF_073020 [Zingiber officinale]